MCVVWGCVCMCCVWWVGPWVHCYDLIDPSTHPFQSWFGGYICVCVRASQPTTLFLPWTKQAQQANGVPAPPTRPGRGGPSSLAPPGDFPTPSAARTPAGSLEWDGMEWDGMQDTGCRMHDTSFVEGRGDGRRERERSMTDIFNACLCLVRFEGQRACRGSFPSAQPPNSHVDQPTHAARHHIGLLEPAALEAGSRKVIERRDQHCDLARLLGVVQRGVGRQLWVGDGDSVGR